jgi:hypothetical protein
MLVQIFVSNDNYVKQPNGKKAAPKGKWYVRGILLRLAAPTMVQQTGSTIVKDGVFGQDIRTAEETERLRSVCKKKPKSASYHPSRRRST